MRQQDWQIIISYDIWNSKIHVKSIMNYSIQHQWYVEYVYGLLTLTKKFLVWNVRY